MEGARSDALAPIIAALPEQFRALPPLTMGSAKQEKKLMEKRDQVLRVVELLSSSKGFDPQALQPFAEALRKPSASVFVQHVAGGLAERVAARMVNVFLLSQDAAAAKPTSASSSAASATATARAASARFW